MTIYHLDLKPQSLVRLPSNLVILELCNHICTRIMIHIQEVVLRSDPSAAMTMISQRADMHRQLDLLKTASFGYQPGDEVRMRIEYLYLRKRGTSKYPSFKSGFGMGDLSHIPIKFLIMLLDKLLRDSMESICGHITGLSRFTSTACMKTLREIPTTLAQLCGDDFYNRYPNMKVNIQFVVGDHSEQVIYLV